MSLRFGERLGQKRTATEVLPPLIGERTHGGGQRLAGQIGRSPLGREQEEAAVLNDEFEPFDALICTL